MSFGAKRKHSDVSKSSRKKSKLLPVSTSKQEKRAVIRGDRLKWREVTAPNLLSDAEGFYGLEEIDDVEVVRDEDTKGVWFRPLSSAAEDSESLADELEDSEWTGFNDSLDEVNHDTELRDRKSNGEELQGDTSDDVAESDHDTRLPVTAADNAEELSDGIDFNLLDAATQNQDVDVSAWKDLELSSNMLSAVSSLGFSTPTQIQQTAIPPIIEGRDVIGKAVTGSGKTLAFSIPIVEKWLITKPLKERKSRETMTALILAPTRELARQITNHLEALLLTEAFDSRPRVATVTGGLSILKQQRQFEVADVVVATPGRLWEVIRESETLLSRLKTIQFLVVDEADRLLSEGHFQEVEEILDALDRKVVEENETQDQQSSTRQTLVFSATFHKGLQQKLASRPKKRMNKDNNLLSHKESLEHLMLKLPFQAGQKPVFVDANPESQMAAKLSETILECAAMRKDLFLYTFLLQDQHQRKNLLRSNKTYSTKEAHSRILVFTNSVSAVKRLVPLLQSFNLPQTTISPLHSSMPQKSRLRSLERFSGSTNSETTSPTTAILIATDVAARGLDIKDVNTIFHYHVPRTADTYVHRSGRTARANNSGNSVLLCSPDEVASVTKLIAKVHGMKNSKSTTDDNNILERMFLSGKLIRQVEKQVELAQKIVGTSQDKEKVKSEDNWLRNAAEELGVDYDSEEFEANSKHGRRGRGGGRERKRIEVSRDANQQSKMAEWKAHLREELNKRIDFGDGSTLNARYLAGGAYDVDQLLSERAMT